VLLRETALTDPAAAALLDEYFDERSETWPADETAYRVTRPDPAAFAPPVGAFLVVVDDERPGEPVAVGCGGIRFLTPTRAEVKHLFLRDEARGRGWGRALLAALEDRARELGATETVLDTNASLAAAQGLYRASGYREIAPYNENPNATHWFAKDL